MKKYVIILMVFVVGCKTQQTSMESTSAPTAEDFNYLALGDSYTIGESVCESCNFPIQLIEDLAEDTNAKIGLQIIAKTGWTTADLIQAIKEEQPASTFDLVTLLTP